MARIGTKLLDAGEAFPHLSFRVLDGPDLSVPDGLTHPFNVLLFYRGWWCKFCQGQLRSFQSGLGQLAAEGIGVVAASVDPRERGEEMRRETGATFPIGYGLEVLRTAELTGAYYDPKPALAPAPHLSATGFLLAPGGKVVTAVYSTNVIGRLGWQDVLGLVQKIKAAPRAK
jgi:peroxiredoxin